MQAYECTAEVDSTGALHLPEAIAVEMMSRKTVRVLVLLDETTKQQEEHRTWNDLTASQFLLGYADSDAIYDAL